MNDVKSSVAMGLHTLTSVPGAGLHRYSPPCSGPSYPSAAGPPSRGAPGPPPNHPPPRMTVTTSSAGNLFGGLDDSLLARAEALAAADLGGKAGSSPGGPAGGKPGMADLYGHDMGGNQGHRGGGGQLGGSLYHGHGGESMLDQLNGGGGGHVSMPLTGITPADHTVTSHSSHMAAAAAAAQMYTPVYSTHPMSSVTNSYQQPQHQHPGMHGASGPHVPGLQSPMGGGPGGVQGGGPLGVMVHHPGGPGGPGGPHELDCDPRELEAFAEHFKQRRIKLGVTQADVGNALGKLKIPGVGSLSQSTICRFESLTLSHNNMIALKPVLQAWLEEAEKAAREASQKADGVFNGADKKRKRTSIAAPEKRSLEAYFAIQPRPSGEKIAQIAEKLDLKKNVVRVWFCNQRQKQKRMKFSASSMQGPHTPHPGH